MTGQIVASQPATSFDFELVDDDSSPKQTSPWIDPTKIKLRHRIGRGPFGDVWLATQNLAAEDYEEYYEVAVKVLHPIKEDNMKVVLSRLEDLFSKCQGLKGLCWLHGISVISGKLCIIMKFLEQSVGDKMARLKTGKLSLQDVLRYGIDLAQGIMELHSREILALNLKPFNFLLNENNQAVLGDLGFPYILLGIPLPSSNMARRLGTPNYMAPEQWQPEVRGPISFESDSWGFACSMVEMLTGTQPWSGKSVDEIFNSVVRKQDRPHIPSGLPPAVENVIIGCFEYDLRNRPLMADILRTFKSSQNAIYRDGGWMGQENTTATKRFSGYTEWFLSKDHFEVGDTVRSLKPPNSCKPESIEVPEGTVVGLERDSDQSGFVLVRMPGIHGPLKVHVSTLERVSFGLAAGDFVRLEAENKKHSPVGVIHSIRRDGSVTVGFIGEETLWKGSYSQFQMAESWYVGQFVKLKSNVFSPRFNWPRKGGGEWATGRIHRVLPNGCLVVKFPGRLTFGDDSSSSSSNNSSFLADPAELEVVSFTTCQSMVKKYQHVEDFHWAVRPILLALGLFTSIKLGHLLVGKRSARSNASKVGNPAIQNNVADGQNGGNASWFPNIFREGVHSAATR